MSAVCPILSIMVPCRYEGPSHGFVFHSQSRSGAAKNLCEVAIGGEGKLECNTESMAARTWRDKVDSAGTAAIVGQTMYFACACARQSSVFSDPCEFRPEGFHISNGGLGRNECGLDLPQQP